MRMHCQLVRLEKFKWSYKMKSGLIDTAARQTHMERRNTKETSCFLAPTCRHLNIESSDKLCHSPLHQLRCTIPMALTEGNLLGKHWEWLPPFYGIWSTSWTCLWLSVHSQHQGWCDGAAGVGSFPALGTGALWKAQWGSAPALQKQVFKTWCKE